MPWCPKCKTEYRSGITVCSDCNTPLVDELTEENVFLPVMACMDKDLAHRFLDYLYYSDITSGKIEENDITFEYCVAVTKPDFKQAKKLYSAFSQIEQEEKTNDMTESAATKSDDIQTSNSGDKIEQLKNRQFADELRSPKTASTVYVRKEERYNDITSTAYVFLLVGVLGILFVILNYIGIISFINGPFSYFIYGALFIGCLVASALSFRSARETKKQISAENTLTTKVNEWLKENITKDALLASHEEGASDEIHFLNEMNYLKELVCEQFPTLNESYADTLCEEYYNEYLE